MLYIFFLLLLSVLGLYYVRVFVFIFRFFFFIISLLERRREQVLTLCVINVSFHFLSFVYHHNLHGDFRSQCIFIKRTHMQRTMFLYIYMAGDYVQLSGVYRCMRMEHTMMILKRK